MNYGFNLPGNVSFAGTVSAPLFVSNQNIIAPYASGTTSTLSLGSITGTFSSMTQSFAATLSVGTILNFSAGGSVGTNLVLTGTFTGPASSITNSAYAATLTVGTLLNFNAGGTVGTNMTLIGTITAASGSINTLSASSISTTFLNVSTLSASTYLNIVFSQSISSSGTTSSTLSPGTLTIGGGGSFQGTVTATGIGINTTSPLYPLDVTGNSRVTGTFLCAYGSLTSGYVSTLSVSTILNFSAGGSLGTNMVLTGSLVANSISATYLTVTSASSLSTLSLSLGSMTQAYAATLSVGTILNFSAGGSVGTNLVLTGTLTSQLGSCSTAWFGSMTGVYHSMTQTYASTLSFGTMLNFLQGQTVSTAGTVVGTFTTGTITCPGGANFAGTLTSSAIGINQTSPQYSLDATGACRVTGNLGIGTTVSTTMQSGIITVGNGTNVLNIASAYSSATISHIETFNSNNSVKNALCLNGYGGNVAINNITPAYPLDVSGSARFTGTVLSSGIINQGIQVPKLQYGTATGSTLTSVTFPTAFVSAPLVFCQPAVSGGSLYVRAIDVTSTSATGFSFTDTYLSNGSSTIGYASNDAMYWMAIGI